MRIGKEAREALLEWVDDWSMELNSSVLVDSLKSLLDGCTDADDDNNKITSLESENEKLMSEVTEAHLSAAKAWKEVVKLEVENKKLKKKSQDKSLTTLNAFIKWCEGGEPYINTPECVEAVETYISQCICTEKKE